MKKKKSKILTFKKKVISNLKQQKLIGGTSASGSFCYTGCICDEPA